MYTGLRLPVLAPSLWLRHLLFHLLFHAWWWWRLQCHLCCCLRHRLDNPKSNMYMYIHNKQADNNTLEGPSLIMP